MSADGTMLTRQPSFDEWRVICTMAEDAVTVAARGARERVFFHGYLVDARMTSGAPGTTLLVELKLCDVQTSCLLDASRIEVARALELRSAWRIHTKGVCYSERLLN